MNYDGPQLFNYLSALSLSRPEWTVLWVSLGVLEKGGGGGGVGGFRKDISDTMSIVTEAASSPTRLGVEALARRTV
jgi:hypothetical protein